MGIVKLCFLLAVFVLQGPLANTCNHFWQMIWEQNTYSVVMLNRVVEKNQVRTEWE